MTQDEHDRQDWSGRTVRGRDGARLGTLTEVYPAGAGAGNSSWGVVRSRTGRRRLVPLDDAATDGARALRVPVDRGTLRSAPAVRGGVPDAGAEAALRRHYTGREALADAHAHQQERFGGMKIGAAFFGWLVAVGMTVLLTGLAAGVAALLGAGTTLDPAGADAAAVGIGGAVTLFVILLLAYFSGGYVAGRLARFDGGHNGVLSWVVGVVVTVVAAAVGAAVGSQLLTQVQLPVVPADPATLTVGSTVALVVALLGTLLAALLGGKAGERFHRRVDRSGAHAA